jgi:polyferredoxin
MKNGTKHFILRGIWYLVGVILFFSPVALFQKLIILFFHISGRMDIHGMCLRSTINSLIVGKLSVSLSISLVALIMLTVATVFLGPLFCGFLCPVGALPEYLSRLIPDKCKIGWSRFINPTPVRYGFFAAFILAPFIVGSSICCAYCNFTFFQTLLDGGFWGSFGILGSTIIVTALLWLVLFGLFTKGGRGFCSFMCPIGAYQNLIYSLTSKLPFVFKLRIDHEKCVSCGICVKKCPMGALYVDGKGQLKHQIHTCILCLQCKAECPKQAISYGLKRSRKRVVNNAAES